MLLLLVPESCSRYDKYRKELIQSQHSLVKEQTLSSEDKLNLRQAKLNINSWTRELNCRLQDMKTHTKKQNKQQTKHKTLVSYLQISIQVVQVKR